MAVERPDSLEDMHEQDWLIVIEALAEYGIPFEEGSDEFHPEALSDPRRMLAFELSALFADHCDIPEGDIGAHIDEGWNGIKR